MKRRVVVTGMGVVTSLSSRLDELWKKLLAGQSGIHPVRLVDLGRGFDVKIGGDVYDWEEYARQYIEHRELKRIDRFTQFAMVATADAVAQSQIDFSQQDPFRCGVILGSGIGGLGEIETGMGRMISKGPDRISAFTVPKMMLNAAGGNLSIIYKLRGPNYAVATACASATNAIGDALRYIQRGECDIVITGGTEAAMAQMGVGAFQNMRALSYRNDEPEKASRPFDRDRDGFVFSEGAGICIFEDYEHAKSRGAPLLAEVIGYGSVPDAFHLTQPREDGEGAALTMQAALKDAGIEPAQVDYINAHGTSTPLGDIAETRAIKTVFGEHAHTVSISSTKSQLGHSLGASGGIELVLSIKAMQEGMVPPTINLDNPDPLCDLDYTPHKPREREINIAISNSFGFGGHNATVVAARLRD